MKKNSKKQKKQIRLRHKIVSAVLRPLIGFYLRLTTGYTYQPFTDIKKEPHLILYNHVSPWDQFFVGSACKSTIYYVAMDDIFAIRFVGRLIKFLINPIPFKKSSSDSGAVKQCCRTVKEGGSIALSPEGNRTYDGYLTHVKPAITKLIRLLNVPVAFFIIDGGYGLNPRWAAKGRRGPVCGYVKKVLYPDEIKGMDDNTLYGVVIDNLTVSPINPGVRYISDEKAEYLERLIYYCPHCGFGKFESEGNFLTCTKCGTEVEYTDDLCFIKDGKEYMYPTVHHWYDAQKRFVEQLDLKSYIDRPVFNEPITMLKIIDGRKTKPIITDGRILLYGDRIVVEGNDKSFVFLFKDISGATVVAKKRFSIYVGKDTYQFKDGERFNSIKFVNMIYHYKNENERAALTYDGRQFLGL